MSSRADDTTRIGDKRGLSSTEQDDGPSEHTWAPSMEIIVAAVRDDIAIGYINAAAWFRSMASPCLQVQALTGTRALWTSSHRQVP